MKRTLIVVALIAALIAPIWAQAYGTTPDGFEWEQTSNGRGIIINDYTGTATTVRIPDRINNLPVVEIGDNAFSPFKTDGFRASAYGITSIVIPNTVTTIGSNAFRNQDQLSSINLPASLTTIRGSAFLECFSLTSISLPASITTIASGAFRNCNSLTTVTIPASVTSITFGGNSAFQGCTSLNAASKSAIQRVGYTGTF